MKTFLLLLTGLDIVWSKIMGDTEAEIPKKWCNFSGTSQTVFTVLKVKMIFLVGINAHKRDLSLRNKRKHIKIFDFCL